MSRYRHDHYDDSYSSKSSDSDDSRTKYKHKRNSRSSSQSRHSSTRRTHNYSKSPSRHSSSKKKIYKSKDKERSSHRRRSASRSSKSSTSKTKHKHSSKKSIARRSSRSSSSRSSSSDRPIVKPAIVSHLKNKKQDDTESKIEKAIKAAEAAGLTMCKLPSYEYKEVEVKEDMPTIQDRNVLNELNSESFVQKQFTSSRNSKKIPENIVIDLNAETIKIPIDVELPKSESLFHDQFFQDEATLKEKWIKELLAFRRRAMRGEIQ